MAKDSENVLTAVLLFLSLNFNQVRSQELGNPISNLNANEFSVSLYGDKVWREMDDSDYSSYRLITKTEFGFYSRFKIFGLIGTEKMFIDYPVISSFTDYKGKTEFALGIGAQVELLNIKKTTFFSGAGILKTSPQGSTIMSDDSGNQMQIDMKFDWREYWFAVGAAYETKRFDVYGGIEERTTKRIELNRETEYVSGFKQNLFLGIDFLFPKNFVLNFHMKILDQNVFGLGISQRSIGKIK